MKLLEAEFVKHFRAYLSPFKAAIKREIKKGRSAHQAVDHVFREYNIRSELKKVVPKLMVKAAKKSK